MRKILVIRFGALGDLCVLSWALSRLAAQQAPGTCRITLVTKAAFAPLMAEVRGVDEVVTLEGSDLAAVRHLAARLRQRNWDVVLDAHNILRSHLLLGLLGRRPQARLDKDTAARLGFMAFGRTSSRLGQSMRERFNTLCDRVSTGNSEAPRDEPTESPLAHLRQAATGADTPILGLAPGAQWDSKRWPVEYFTTLLRQFRDRTNGSVRIYLGPREQSWFAGSDLAAAAKFDEAVDLVQLPNLPDVARSLGAVDVLVTNDSGLLHVAEAVGTRVLAFFGPTVREFGYFPLLSGSRVLETELSCRPCSRNGKRPCHRGDLACLTAVSPEAALENILAMLQKERLS